LLKVRLPKESKLICNGHYVRAMLQRCPTARHADKPSAICPLVKLNQQARNA